MVALAERIEQIAPPPRNDYSAALIIDANEQRIERSQNQQQAETNGRLDEKCYRLGR